MPIIPTLLQFSINMKYKRYEIRVAKSHDVIKLRAVCCLLSGGCAIILVALGGHAMFGCSIKIEASKRQRRKSPPSPASQYIPIVTSSIIIIYELA
mmetsp:Transcript_9779/g.17610  ORF Transcript_9779/g.17610 Transcript_9779/m.17610 type:complete len:96 (-) Transcript_9779:12-299(-)